jgi:hypothetical protein
MTMYDQLAEFLSDEEIIMSDMMDRFVDQLHDSVSEQKYLNARTKSMALQTVEGALRV